MDSQIEILKELHSDLYTKFQKDLKEFKAKYGGMTFKFNKQQGFDKDRFKRLI